MNEFISNPDCKSGNVSTLDQRVTMLMEAATIAMHDFSRIEAFLDSIALISTDAPDKTGGCIYVLAREGAALCAKAHEVIDLDELESLRTSRKEGK